jgi:superfamily II DNA or RNA helicase
MARSVRLRPWQKRALDRLAGSGAPDFLAVATPGAGKTTFALVAAVQDMAASPGRGLVVVAPTSHLKLQWADAAGRFGLHLEPRWTPGGGRLPADVHGIVTTYQQVASSPDALRELAARSLVVLDEIHHAGDDRAWGESVRRAFEVAPRRLSLSGTPFRSDTLAIPFVRYVGDEAVPDFEYGYADALVDGRVVRPVYFPRINGFMEWIAPDGSAQAAAFDDALDRALSAQRLRTALSLEGEWLATVLLQADERLGALRRSQPDAGGLVIAADQDHAQGIADLLRHRCGARATVAVSDDPLSSSASPGSRPRATPGSWPCAWCPRASTSPASGSASTPRRPRPSCSSARRWAGSCAGPGACPARRRTCSSPTTPACAPGPARSRTFGATACTGWSATAATSRRPPGPRSTTCAIRTTGSTSSRCSPPCRPW